jgi:hypothetical protein
MNKFYTHDKKKLTSKELRQLLQDFQPFGLRAQKELLSDSFHKWRGDTTQTDDLIIVTIEIP